jgi:hypothetical protein
MRGSKLAIALLCLALAHVSALIAAAQRNTVEPSSVGPPPTEGNIPQPSVRIRLDGTSPNAEDIRRSRWHANVVQRGNDFEGTITFPDLPVIPPLEVEGSTSGSVVVFSILANGTEVATFGGNLAGTNLTGVINAITGEKEPLTAFWDAATEEDANETR